MPFKFNPLEKANIKYAITSYLTSDVYVVEIEWSLRNDDEGYLTSTFVIKGIETLAPYVGDEEKKYILIKIEEYINGMITMVMDAATSDPEPAPESELKLITLSTEV